MFRVANIIMVIALLATAVVVYQLKYASTMEAERLATLRASIRKERDAISLMKAEWARRTSPIYIQGLVERHLDMKRLDVASMTTLNDLPARPANNDDGIGGMIEALVDEPLVTSSISRSAPVAAAPAISADSPSVPASSALRPAPRPAAAPAPRPAQRQSTNRAAPPPPPAYYSASPARAPAQAPAGVPSYAEPPPPPVPAYGGAPILPPGSLPGAR